jgi:ankyrin repeat protein
VIQPDDLKHETPWVWSPGRGTDVWEMFLACAAGDLGAVNKLVQKDPSLVRSHYQYRTPLSFAVRNDRLEVAEYLIDRGALKVGLGDPREMARDRGLVAMERLLDRKLAELYGASERGEAVAAAILDYDQPRARALIEASPDLVRAGDRFSSQPIHWATMTRQPGLIEWLAGRGADLDAQRMDGARPIHLTNGDYSYRGWRDVPKGVTVKPDEVYRLLASLGATVDVWMAAFKGDGARVRELIDADPSLVNRVSDYNSYYPGCGSALRNAAAGGHLEIVRLLLSRGADPNLPEEHIAPRGHALYAAVYHGHYEIARLLLEHGANPDAPVESSADAVWIAIGNGDLRMVELLASHGATWTIPNSTPWKLKYRTIAGLGLRRSMEVLAHFGDVDGAVPLLKSDPSLADDPDALRAAAVRGHTRFVRLLLSYRPDLARRVTVSRPRKMAEYLFSCGMDPNRPDWLLRTPLHHFASGGDVGAARLFLDRGADLEARDSEDQARPLAFAAKEGRKAMVKFLLGRGAKLRHPDDPEWATPLAWARRRGHRDLARLLE